MENQFGLEFPEKHILSSNFFDLNEIDATIIEKKI